MNGDYVCPVGVSSSSSSNLICPIEQHMRSVASTGQQHPAAVSHREALLSASGSKAADAACGHRAHAEEASSSGASSMLHWLQRLVGRPGLRTERSHSTVLCGNINSHPPREVQLACHQA